MSLTKVASRQNLRFNQGGSFMHSIYRNLLLTSILVLTGCMNQTKPMTEETNPSVVESPTVQMTERVTKSTTEIEKRSVEMYQAGSLLTAVEANDSEKVKVILASKDYPINEQNNRGESPLLIATHNNQVEIAKALIKAGADVNLQDHIQDSAYLYAGAQGKTEILAFILENSQPNQQVYNRFGGNALIPAAEKGHLNNVRLLLEEGSVDIDHQNNYGYTALIEAVALRDGSKIYQDIVKELLAYGADTMLRDKYGKTAEDYAKELGYQAMLDELQK